MTRNRKTKDLKRVSCAFYHKRNLVLGIYTQALSWGHLKCKLTLVLETRGQFLP